MRLEKGAVAMIGFCFLVVFVTFMTIKMVQSRVMRKQVCEQRHAWEATVITSYSIHYTKLYEAGSSFHLVFSHHVGLCDIKAKLYLSCLDHEILLH